MKKCLMALLMATSSFALEMKLDTLNNSDNKLIYVNTYEDSVYFDSASVKLIKAEVTAFQLNFDCYLGDKHKEIIYSSFLPPNPAYYFKFGIKKGDSIIVKNVDLDFCIACIPEMPFANPPKPMQAQMTFYSNKGIDSIIINGFQTRLSSTNIGRRQNLNEPAKISSPGLDYYTLSGKRLSQKNCMKNADMPSIIITSERAGDRMKIQRRSMHR
jgi:hypothetical protein